MAYEEILQNITLEASGDLSGSQYRFVNIDGNGQAAVAGAGDHAHGVLQNDPDAAEKACTVAVFGISKVEAGDAVALGASVGADASGRAVTPAGASGDAVLGVALEAAGAAGELIPVLLQFRGAA